MRIGSAPTPSTTVSSDFDLLRLRILKQKKMAVRSGWAQNIAFTSTEARFNSDSGANDVPPPSAYFPKMGLADLAPKPNARGGAFGSKDTVRCVYLYLTGGTILIVALCVVRSGSRRQSPTYGHRATNLWRWS